ncbi:MAG: hypothetical protein HXY40_02810 [Chloroflexi bacterium]|nr:hypothetical protein [Chloroflexota bacterium]
MRNLILKLAACAVLLILVPTTAAQNSGGQFCVRAYEDRNANGIRDAGEPFLTRGITAELANAQGIILASALLEESPTAAQGVICFPMLAAGQYTLTVRSADFRASAGETLTAQVSAGGLPIVLEYGGTSLAAAALPTPASGFALSGVQGRALIERVVAAALGALIVVALMTLFGAFVWLAILRPRARRLAARRATSTGHYRAVTRDEMLAMYGPPPTSVIEDEPNIPR